MLTFGDLNSRSAISFAVDEAFRGGEIQFKQWYDGIRMVYVLSGTADITIDRHRFDVNENDLFVINAFQFYSFTCSDAALKVNLLSLQIPLEIIQQFFHLTECPLIECKSFLCPPENRIDLVRIRHLYADLFRMFYKKQHSNIANIHSKVFELLEILSSRFRAIDSNEFNPQTRQKSVRFFQNILTFIHANYRSSLNAGDIAKANYVSSSYISHCFQKMLGTTFTDYVNSVRLKSAVAEFSYANKTITAIALSNGFPNVSAFIGAFRRQYGMTPGRYRNRLLAAEKISKEPVPGDTDIFLELLRYETEAERKPSDRKIVREYTVNAMQSGHELVHAWKNLINIGYANEGLLSSVQEQLRFAQQKIGFRYIRFQGLLNDEMMVYLEDESGCPRLNFSLVDILFDFVLSIGLLPYVEFSFMPALLAKHKDRHFRLGVYMSVPNDMKKWLFVIRSFLDHFKSRYGRRVIQQWNFCIFSINYAVIGAHNDFDEYCDLYLQTYQLIKKVDSEYRVSGPGAYAGRTWQDEYLRKFIQFCINNNCVPDQISFWCYPYQTISDKDIFLKMPNAQEIFPEALSEDEDFVRHAVEDFRSMLLDMGLKKHDVIMEAWNSTMWQREISSETCFKSAFLVKNIVENYDIVKGMGYWVLIDMMEEIEPTTDLFHGGFGLCTFQGIPKSAMGAMQLLAKLGNHFLFSGEGCFVTRSASEIQILLYHYCHFDTLYRHHFRTGIRQDAYDCFVEKGALLFDLQITGLEAGRYQISRYAINRSSGSPYDFWINMGSPHRLTDETLEWLRHKADPDYKIEELEVAGNNFHLSAELAPHEIQLLTLRFY